MPFERTRIRHYEPVPARVRFVVAMTLAMFLVACGSSSSTATVQGTGDWQQVESSATPQTNWTLYQASGSNDGVCVSLDLVPSFSDNPSAVVMPATYRDRPAVCGFRPNSQHWRSRVAGLLGTHRAKSRFDFIVGLVPDSAHNVTASGSAGELPNVITVRTSPQIFLMTGPPASLDRVSFDDDAGHHSCTIRWTDGVLPIIEPCP